MVMYLNCKLSSNREGTEKVGKKKKEEEEEEDERENNGLGL